MNKIGHCIFIGPKFYTEMYEWCEENFGPESKETWQMLANNEIGGQIYFIEHENAVLFKLTWC